MVGKDVVVAFNRFDEHESKRAKNEIAELRSIGDKLERMIGCLTDISTSLQLLSTTAMMYDSRGSADDPIFVYDCNALVGAIDKDGKFVKIEESEDD